LVAVSAVDDAPYVLGALLLLFGGLVLGSALGRRWVRGRVVGGAIAVVGTGLIVLSPVKGGTRCRIDSDFLGEGEHPRELACAWVGWATTNPAPYCRLDLEENGTGRCALWDDGSGFAIWRVTSWHLRKEQLEIDLESGERHEQLCGRLRWRSIFLDCLGQLLHLVPEETMEEAQLGATEALESRGPR
jgi:hypothetical protein